MTQQPTPLQIAVAAYWESLKGPVPWISTSHHTLWRLYREFGIEAVDAELKTLQERVTKPGL